MPVATPFEMALVRFLIKEERCTLEEFEAELAKADAVREAFENVPVPKIAEVEATDAFLRITLENYLCEGLVPGEKKDESKS